MVSVSPKIYQRMYHCLGGKGTSCVRTGHFFLDKIGCSLGNHLKDFPKHPRLKIQEKLRNILSLNLEGLRSQGTRLNLEELAELMVKEGFLIKTNNGYKIKHHDVIRFVAPELYALINNPQIYTTKDMIPPAENKPNSIRLELAIGCAYNKCTFCSGYKGTHGRTKSIEEFQEHVRIILERLGDYSSNIQKAFIGGGNALSVDQQTLLTALDLIKKSFGIDRISLYARTEDIREKGVGKLKNLKKHGLKLIYWGIETGSNELLEYIKKGSTKSGMIKAGNIANRAQIPLSLMIMPGLGGIRFYEQHVNETIELLNMFKSTYITFMCINPDPGSAYASKMALEQSKGKNRPLTQLELKEQTKDIISGLIPCGQKIGMFGPEIDQASNNPFAFKKILRSRETISSLIHELSIS